MKCGIEDGVFEFYIGSGAGHGGRSFGRVAIGTLTALLLLVIDQVERG